ncbi:hypothetical protein [Phnomibacter sp. MR]|uniref:hypothetical protein n=1 Tax=Phnomibacter sp. MR TaxID=3042318 RepID=UPI003A800377
MYKQWQHRQQWAKPILWLLLLMLVNTWLNADTTQTNNSQKQAYDDIDSFAEWLCETVADDDQLLPENTQDDQDEQSNQLHKYQWVKDLMLPHQYSTLFAVEPILSFLYFGNAALSKGFLQQHFTPPNAMKV